MEPNANSDIPLASNPATAEKLGLNNQLLNGSDETNGLSPKELSGFLTKVVNGYKGEAMTSELEQFLAKAKNDEVIDALKKIGNAEKFYETNATPITDPSTGKQDPKASELAAKLLEKIKPLIEAKRMYNHRIAQTVQKKKKEN